MTDTTNTEAASAASTPNSERLLAVADAIERSLVVEHTRHSKCQWTDVLLMAADGAEPTTFNMGCWLSTVDYSPDGEAVACGTAGCIAGYATMLFKDEALAIRERMWKEAGYCCLPDMTDVARELLGLSDWEAGHLFIPNDQDLRYCRLHEVTAAEAAACLRLVADGIMPRTAWERVIQEDRAS